MGRHIKKAWRQKKGADIGRDVVCEHGILKKSFTVPIYLGSGLKRALNRVTYFRFKNSRIGRSAISERVYLRTSVSQDAENKVPFDLIEDLRFEARKEYRSFGRTLYASRYRGAAAEQEEESSITIKSRVPESMRVKICPASTPCSLSITISR